MDPSAWVILVLRETVHGATHCHEIQLFQLQIPMAFLGPSTFAFIDHCCSRKSSLVLVGLPKSLARQLRTLFWQGHLRPGWNSRLAVALLLPQPVWEGSSTPAKLPG